MKKVAVSTNVSHNETTPLKLKTFSWQTYEVFPSESTAGKGTQPLKTFRYGLNLSIRSPSVVAGTVSAKPTTASWAITARAWRAAAAGTLFAVEGEVGAARTEETARAARLRMVEWGVIAYDDAMFLE